MVDQIKEHELVMKSKENLQEQQTLKRVNSLKHNGKQPQEHQDILKP